MRLSISSQKETTEYTQVLSVTMVSTKGSLQLKQGHAELFAMLVPSDVLICSKNKKDRVVKIASGMCHCLDDVVTILL